MEFKKTAIAGVYTIELEKQADERGFFARYFCKREFLELGLETEFVQANNSFSAKEGTLRGLHYQLPPYAESKLIRCLSGSLFDVVLDLRPSSPTFGASVGVELSARNRTMVYVPEGCAHGFLTLEANTEIFYMVTAYYSKQYERTVRWNDPKFHIKWPRTPAVLSEKDAKAADFKPEIHLAGMEAFA